MKPLHRLLIRQLKRNQVSIENTSDELISLAESISSSYEHYESSKKLIERAMEISDLELAQANIKLIEESNTQNLLIESLKESIKDISIDGNEIENNDLLQISQILKLEIQKRKAVEENLKKTQKLAEESLKSKEQFLANMSHEIRTPLNAILGMVWLLSRTNLNSKQKEYKEVLKTSAENLLVIIPI
jgi:signal transduction histidine kinase